MPRVFLFSFRPTIAILFGFAIIAAMAFSGVGDCVPSQYPELLASNDTVPGGGNVTLSVPLKVLWTYFIENPSMWPVWNPAYKAVGNTSIALCEPLKFTHYSYIAHLPQPAVATPFILSFDGKDAALWWSYNTFGIFGVQKQSFFADGNTTVYTNWEKAMGCTARILAGYLHNQFDWVTEQTIFGLQCLEKVYLQYGALENSNVSSQCNN